MLRCYFHWLNEDKIHQRPVWVHMRSFTAIIGEFFFFFKLIKVSLWLCPSLNDWVLQRCSTCTWLEKVMTRSLVLFVLLFRDTMDSVKQSAALCLLRLNRTSPDLVPMGEWTARVVHLLNDQHLVRLCSRPHSTRSKNRLVLLHSNYDKWQQTAPDLLHKHWQRLW